ncbi:ribosome small subunit-dependent GTPase A [Pseudodesulfovibrio sediminis]|uniref:Small ribosomal subunit biogenesis GTPase RsgA n=1 Tax=Pseudodesulfovibrio sediminis TaxID=2810563 RepID=A0ABM7P8N2_9BACT|nr:ribosome small subunit-dependent GTPase A [Pseudodesulfovibrio sediminis]BCS89370.1 putative ribosome biogenesis GTPase RsgA [Pseudodesulfovibrio sediminis]
MTGKIIKGVGGFYCVHVPGKGVYECRARGIFRKDKIKPLIGDNVDMALVDDAKKIGNIEKIFDRDNSLNRPTVANLDQAVIVFAVSQPEPNYNLLDRFLVMVEANGIDAIICFNKIDILSIKQVDTIVREYEKIGYAVLPTSSIKDQGIGELKALLYGKTTVFAGPSGVGKSSILNLIQDEMVLETGSVSDKNSRGKHTTRHAELICFHDDSYVVDTPGFSSLESEEMEANQLKHYFREFVEYESECKFSSCLHLNEPKCGVKEAVAAGHISESRYASYKQLVDELLGS